MADEIIRIERTDPEVEPKTIDDITPLTDEVDHRWAGEPLDSWIGHVPEPSVVTATEMAVEHIGQKFIGFCVPRELESDYATYIKHQRRAGRAFALSRWPHLSVKYRTRVLPFKGVSDDVRVFYVYVGKSEQS